MRRFATLALSLSLLLGLNAAQHLFASAQDPKKDEPKAEEKKADAPKADAPKADETKKDEPKKEEPKKEEPKPIPPEVQKKIDAARKAVAEAIVAAQDAGLVKTSIEPPPILDILITGRADDEDTLKARTGVSPEVFGAWFTGYGKTPGVVAQTDVRITQPSGGLKSWYDQRANLLNREIEAVRKANGTPAPAPAAATPAPAPATPAPPPAETKKAEEPKKDEPKAEEKKAEEPKKDEPKGA